MRIAIFTDSFLPGTGGTEQAVKRLATALSKTDEVMVCAPDYHTNFDDSSSFPFKVARAKSIKLTSNDFWARPFYSRKFKKTLEEFAEVREAIVSHKDGTAIVTLDADLGVATLKKAVEDKGYKVID